MKMTQEKEFIRNLPHGMGNLLAAQFVCVGSHWLRVLARCHPVRFEMLHRTRENPRTVNREHQHGDKNSYIMNGPAN
jgi:hypothetical protein